MTRTLHTMSTGFLLVASLSVAAPALAQDPAQVQRWFESGRFQQVTEASSPTAPPSVRFLAGQSLIKQGMQGQAIEAFKSLSSEPESSPWHFIGRSAELLLQNQNDEALANAQQAIALDGALTEAHFQLGLVHSRRAEWQAAADAFDRASEIDIRYAYAHYYGGLAQSRAGHPDKMAVHFEQFLRVAPEAPERPEVAQLMRTVRGR